MSLYEYSDGDTLFEGYLAIDQTQKIKRPCVMVTHAWDGPVLHGWEDPVVPQQSVLSFAEEMTKAGADWQLHCYGNAKHAFTFVGADIPEFGGGYFKGCQPPPFL